MTIQAGSTDPRSPPARKRPYPAPRIDSLDAKTVVRLLGTAQAIGGSGSGSMDEFPVHPGRKPKKHHGRG